MMLEALQIHSKWLRGEKGVNVMLAAIGRVAGAEAPEPVVLVANQAEDARVARWEEPLEVPALYVTTAGSLVLTGPVMTIERRADAVPIAVWYVGRSVNVEIAQQEMMHTLRAVTVSISELMKNDYVDDRTLNGVVLTELTSILIEEAEEPIGELGATGLVLFTWKARDTLPFQNS